MASYGVLFMFRYSAAEDVRHPCNRPWLTWWRSSRKRPKSAQVKTRWRVIAFDNGELLMASLLRRAIWSLGLCY